MKTVKGPCGTDCNSKRLEATHVSTDRGLSVWVMVHLCNATLCSVKKNMRLGILWYGKKSKLYIYIYKGRKKKCKFICYLMCKNKRPFATAYMANTVSFHFYVELKKKQTSRYGEQIGGRPRCGVWGGRNGWKGSRGTSLQLYHK